MKMCVQRVITPEGVLDNTSITVEDGIIVAIEPAGDKPVQSGTLMPGYFDTQVNGCGGVLFNQHPDAESLNKLASAHLRFGTTSMLPTLITDGEAAMASAADMPFWMCWLDALAGFPKPVAGLGLSSPLTIPLTSAWPAHSPCGTWRAARPCAH